MKIIDLEQGSDLWLDFRYCHITSTDSASILGLSPYKSIQELWLEKTKRVPPKKSNARMKRGNDLEPIARNFLIQQTGIDFKPTVVVHDTLYYLMASLDGISSCERFLCEIKCPSISNHILALEGSVIPTYYCQCMHHLAITGCDKCYYFSYNPDFDGVKTVTIEILPDMEYIQAMIEKEREFYFEYLMKDVEPPKEWTFTPKESREQ